MIAPIAKKVVKKAANSDNLKRIAIVGGGLGISYIFSRKIIQKLREGTADRKFDEEATQQALSFYTALGLHSIWVGANYDKAEQIALTVSDFGKVQKRYSQKYNRDLISDIQDKFGKDSEQLLNIMRNSNKENSEYENREGMAVVLKRGTPIHIEENYNVFTSPWHSTSEELYVKNGFSNNSTLDFVSMDVLRPRLRKIYANVDGVVKTYYVPAYYAEVMTWQEFTAKGIDKKYKWLELR